MLTAVIKSDIKRKITGTVSISIPNRLSSRIALRLLAGCNHKPYRGDTEIVPAFENIVLETTDKVIKSDITVLAIRVQRFQNEYGGETVIIG